MVHRRWVPRLGHLLSPLQRRIFPWAAAGIAWLLFTWWRGAGIGSVADWAAAIGTVAAFTVTTIGLDEARRQQAASAAQRRAVYAERCASWCEVRSVPNEGRSEVRLVTLNDGPLPIYHLRARVAGDSQWHIDEKVVPPGQRPSTAVATYEGDPLPMTELEFVDSYGLSWKRPASGQLLEVPSPTPMPKRSIRDRLWDDRDRAD